MASNFVIITGKSKWFKLFEGQEDKYGKNSIDLYFTDNDERKKFMALRAKNTLREDDDGFFVKLYRNPQQEQGHQSIGYAKVLDSDNQPWDPKKLIGNGSEVAVKLEHFSWDNEQGTQYGVRVAAVKVTKWLEYKKEAKPAAAAAAAKPAEKKEGLNDPMPF